MNILKQLLEFVSYRENIDREGFILKETKDDQKSPESSDKSTKNQKTKPRGRTFKKPVRPSDITKKNNTKNTQEYYETTSSSLEENRKAVGKLYGLPDNKDVVIRDFMIGTSDGVRAFAVFIDGMTDKTLQDFLFQSLMVFAKRPLQTGKEKLAGMVRESLLPANQATLKSRFSDILDAVNYGDTALFFDGCADVLLVETKGWEHRPVEKPTSEQIIRGPHEAFTETLRANTALLRKSIRNEQLTTDIVQVGERDRRYVAIMYLRDLANKDLVAEVKRRVKSIRTDSVLGGGILEELIEDNPYNLTPTSLVTERPDRVAAGILDGRVALIIDGSPFVTVVPSTMYEQLHTGEELYHRWQYGTFIRLLRALAFLLSFLLPGLYLSVVLFHQEMIPTELLLAIAGARERVPFPSVVEVLLMEFSFELIREAGLRIPSVMGTTIGIVGALILGQAAVQANIVSPILVILVAVTGLSSFAIPYHSLAFSLRIYRFMYIFLGATLGFYGLAMGLFAQIILTANLKSFGVPFLAPTGPKTMAGPDIVFRLPMFFHERRPDYLNPQDIKRQPKVSRGWIRQNGGDDNS